MNNWKHYYVNHGMLLPLSVLRPTQDLKNHDSIVTCLVWKKMKSKKVQYHPVNNKLQNVSIPIILGNKSVMLNTGIVASDIPLLISRKSMKKADMTLDFKNYNVMISGESIQLMVTKSGSCAIPVCWYSTILNNVTTGLNKRNPVNISHT